MTKSKFSAPFITFPSIFVLQLVNGAQFLNATSVTRLPVAIVLSPFTKM